VSQPIGSLSLTMHRTTRVLTLFLLCIAANSAGCHRSRSAPEPLAEASLAKPPDRKVATTPRPSAPALNFPHQGGGSQVRVQRAFPNLFFREAIDLAAPRDGTDRLFVASKDGLIKVFANRDDVATATTFLDLSGRVHNWFEVGLLGLTFDPDYARNGYFYVHYVDPSFDSVIARYRVSAADPNRADPNSEQVYLRVRQPEGNHNGGALQFGPDGMLYVAFGDGGGLDDQYGHAQNLNTLLGSMLRIDPHGSTNGLPYGIPRDNPLVGTTGRGEIWAWGLRSPWRFSIDPATGVILLGDVGQDFHDEVDVIRRAGNYGWPFYEGPRSHLNPRNRPPTDFDQPAYTDARSEMRSVIGGHVYRGARIAALVGEYVFGDHVHGTVWGMRWLGSQASKRVLGHVPNLASFGVDAQGELFAVSFDGTIHRIVETGGPAPLPALISQTGLLRDPRSAAWIDGLMPIQVNSPLWSDHAHKTRFFTVPDDKTIGFHPTSAWAFPVGSVLVKHFEMEMVVGAPSSRRRLETRVMVHQPSGWTGGTYRWNAAQTDAALVTTRAAETLTVRDPAAPNGQRIQDWTYPGVSDCVQCHLPAAGHVLGLTTPQAQRPLPGGQNQLGLLNQMRFFDRDIGAPTQYAALPDPADPRHGRAARARAYLAANCASCHRPGGVMQGEIDLRFDTPIANTGLWLVRPTRGDLGLGDPYRIKPWNHRDSVLWHRLAHTGPARMPPLGSAVVDPLGAQVVRDWIDDP
jgi:uncharacterized repeat protein (TIGR03806 family)